MKEHDLILDEKNRIEVIESEIYVSIGTQNTMHGYNDEFWYSI